MAPKISKLKEKILSFKHKKEENQIEIGNAYSTADSKKKKPFYKKPW